MICSNIKLTGPVESIGIAALAIHEWNQGDSKMKPAHAITLDHETDFEGWRKAARALVLSEVQPPDVTWRVRGATPEPFERSAPPLEPPHGTFSVSAKFVELAQAAILHRDRERFAILYRLLWRLRGDRDLLDVATDSDVARVSAMATAVHRDTQRMQANI